MAKLKKRLRYFYLDGNLHKVLSINHPQDICVAWNYPQERRVGYVWSDLRKRYENAFPISKVAQMIGRHRVNIEKYILEEKIPAPQRIYALNENRLSGKYFFSENDVYNLHDYLMTVHIGRPRKDGKISPGMMPSKAELRAMMRHDVQMYTKTQGGDYVPVWKEIDW